MANRNVNNELLRKLKVLEIEEQELSFIKNAKFSSKEEYDIFAEKYAEQFLRLKSIQQERKKIEWDIKTSAQKQEERYYLIGLQAKFEGESEVRKKYAEALDLLISLSANPTIDLESKDRIESAIATLDQIVFPIVKSD